MFGFIKNNSYLIFRQIAIQIGMTMFGLVLSMAVSGTPGSALMLVIGIFAVVFYLYLLADAAFSVGYKEHVKIEAGRAPYSPFKGLLVSLCANFLNIALALGLWVGFIVNAATGTSQTWVSILKYIALGIQGMYAGIVGYVNTYISDASIVSTIMYTAIVIPSLLVSTVAYRCGEKNIHIVPGYKGNQNPKY